MYSLLNPEITEEARKFGLQVKECNNDLGNALGGWKSP